MLPKVKRAGMCVAKHSFTCYMDNVLNLQALFCEPLTRHTDV